MRARTIGSLVVGLVGLGQHRALADPLPTSAEHIATPGRSVAADDTSDAIVLNPANLAWLPAPEARWTWVNCPDEAIMIFMVAGLPGKSDTGGSWRSFKSIDAINRWG